MTTVLQVYGGICNRLRTILSWRAATRDDLIVAWEPNGEIANEHFEDTFEKLWGVNFVDAPYDHPSMPKHGWPKRLDVHPNAPIGWERAWSDVRLRTPWYPIVGHYSAIHVRRTDCEYMQREERTWRPDSDFLKWCRLASDAIYLATDNGTTQTTMTAALLEMGKRVLTHESILSHDKENEGGVRNTSLRHAWCDVLACVGSTHFMGSGSSSFTTTIETMRRLRA